MDDVSQPSLWGSLALVTYIPHPLGSFLDGLRRSLTGEDCPPAHVTVLPPRPLPMPVERASQHLLTLLASFDSFPVELSSIQLFRETNVLYLAVAEGTHQLHAIHDALNSGDLLHQEAFEFRPHLTLTHPAQSTDLEGLRQRASESWKAAALNRRFPLEEIVCLWLPPHCCRDEWRSLWSYGLETKVTVRQPPSALAATGQTY